jgi:ferredoxin
MAIGFSLLLFLLVLLTGLLTPRFWCRYVCPTGALIALPSLLRLNQRQIKPTCTQCGECATGCPFDAINEDISTRSLDCAYCRTCLGVCPTDSLYFAPGLPPAAGAGSAPPFSRRAWLGSVAAGAATALTARVGGASSRGLLRPPGSVAEEKFMDLCVRCGECFKVCPGSALQPAGLETSLEALWTPVLVPTQAGCHPDCNFCTQACPTGAIRPLALGEKRKFKIGVAVIDPQLCLSRRGERDCQLCFDECEAAGYHAVEMRFIKLAVGEVPPGAVGPGELEEMARIKAPFVLAEACVGCGLCEYRCHAAVHRQQKLLPRRAIVVKQIPFGNLQSQI